MIFKQKGGRLEIFFKCLLREGIRCCKRLVLGTQLDFSVEFKNGPFELLIIIQIYELGVTYVISIGIILQI